MDAQVEVSFPNELYAVLAEQRRIISEGFKELREEFSNKYRENIANDSRGNEQQVAPQFNRYEKVWEKIGSAIFHGGLDYFFKKLDKYEDDEAYKKTAQVTETKEPIIPKIEVVTEEKSGKSQDNKTNSTIDSLLGIVAGALLLFGIKGGTSMLGQGMEMLAFLPRYLKNTIFDSKWMKGILEHAGKGFRAFSITYAKQIKVAVEAVNKVFRGAVGILKHIPRFLTSELKNLQKLYPAFTPLFKTLRSWSAGIYKVIHSLDDVAKIGSGVMKSFNTVVKPLKGLVGLITKAAGPIIGRATKGLKMFPLIGLILSAYQAYLRFERGEWFQGILEIVGGLASLGGPLGIAISLGIGALQVLIDNGEGGTATGMGIKWGLSLAAGAGKKFLPRLLKAGSSLLKLGMKALKFIPVVGTLISFGFAIYDFFNGEILSGCLNLLSGLVGLLDLAFPPLGRALSFAVDLLNVWLTSGDSGEKTPEVSKKEEDNGPGIWAKIKSGLGAVWDALCGFVKWLWDKICWFFDTIVFGPIKFVLGIPGKLKEFISDLIPSFDDITNGIRNFGNNVKDKLSGALDSITGGAKDLVKGGLDFANDKLGIDISYEDVKSLASGDLEKAKEIAGKCYTAAKDKAKELAKSAANTIKSKAKQVLGWFGWGSDDEEEESTPEPPAEVKKAQAPAPEVKEQATPPATKEVAAAKAPVVQSDTPSTSTPETKTEDASTAKTSDEIIKKANDDLVVQTVETVSNVLPGLLSDTLTKVSESQQLNLNLDIETRNRKFDNAIGLLEGILQALRSSRSGGPIINVNNNRRSGGGGSMSMNDPRLGYV